MYKITSEHRKTLNAENGPEVNAKNTLNVRSATFKLGKGFESCGPVLRTFYLDLMHLYYDSQSICLQCFLDELFQGYFVGCCRTTVIFAIKELFYKLLHI